MLQCSTSTGTTKVLVRWILRRVNLQCILAQLVKAKVADSIGPGSNPDLEPGTFAQANEKSKHDKHRPYVEKAIQCQNEWMDALLQICGVLLDLGSVVPEFVSM